MIEIFQIFWSSPIELRVIILGCVIGGIYWHFKDDFNRIEFIDNIRNKRKLKNILKKGKNNDNNR
jgi:hypothetical protein